MTTSYRDMNTMTRKKLVFSEFCSASNIEYLKGAILKYMRLCCPNNKEKLAKVYKKYMQCFSISFQRFLDQRQSRTINDIGYDKKDYRILVQFLNEEYLRSVFVDIDRILPREEIVYKVGDGYNKTYDHGQYANMTVEQKLDVWKKQSAPKVLGMLRDDYLATNFHNGNEKMLGQSQPCDSGITYYNKQYGSNAEEEVWGTATDTDNIDFEAGGYAMSNLKREMGYLGKLDRIPRYAPRDMGKCTGWSKKPFDITDEMLFNKRNPTPGITKPSDILTKNGWGQINGIPVYRIKASMINVEMNENENLGGAERTNDVIGGYNMNPLYKRVHYRADEIAKLKKLAGIKTIE